MPIVKNQKIIKEMQIMDKTMNKKMNKTVKTKSLEDFMIKNNIKSETKLFAIADEQKMAGKEDIANFVLSRLTKALSDLLENIWESK